MSFISILVFVLIFSFLVIIHELGHFWAAKMAGVRVEEFGLGLPPRFAGKKFRGTLFSLNAIPFGGFVKLKGEGDENSEPDSMASKPYGWRALVIVAGVLMNFISAYLVLCVAMWLGMPPIATDPAKVGLDKSLLESSVVVVDLQSGLPAEKAGFEMGDVVVSVDGKEISSVSDLHAAVQNKKQVQVGYLRDGKDAEVQVATANLDGQTVLGMGVQEVAQKANYNPWRVPAIAAVDAGNLVVQIAVGVWHFVVQIFTEGKIAADVTGPIGIAKVTAQAVKLGLLSVLQLVIFLSINLGLINLFPFPALDGGRLVFLIAEVVTRGKKLATSVEAVIHNVGFIALLVLIAVVTYRDIVNLF